MMHLIRGKPEKSAAKPCFACTLLASAVLLHPKKSLLMCCMMILRTISTTDDKIIGVGVAYQFMQYSYY